MMVISAIRTVIIYIFIITAMRIMGKRQLGELQPVELVVTLLISDLAAVPMQESGIPLLNGLIPILVLVSLELLLSGLMLKLPFFSRLVSGNPVPVIRDGCLDQKALKKLRLTVDDLMETLREQNVFELRDVQYAIAETGGKISVFQKPDIPDKAMPAVVVSDGQVCRWALQLCALDETWVYKVLSDNACPLNHVFLMTATKSREYYIVRKDGKQE